MASKFCSLLALISFPICFSFSGLKERGGERKRPSVTCSCGPDPDSAPVLLSHIEGVSGRQFFRFELKKQIRQELF